MSTPATPTQTSTNPFAAGNLIEDALAAWQTRLAELDREIEPLAAEADTLRTAIERVQDSAPKPRASRPARNSHETILSTITGRAKTASQISAETGIPVGTVSGALRTLTNNGHATKATKGYQAM